MKNYVLLNSLWDLFHLVLFVEELILGLKGNVVARWISAYLIYGDFCSLFNFHGV